MWSCLPLYNLCNKVLIHFFFNNNESSKTMWLQKVICNCMQARQQVVSSPIMKHGKGDELRLCNHLFQFNTWLQKTEAPKQTSKAVSCFIRTASNVCDLAAIKSELIVMNKTTRRSQPATKLASPQPTIGQQPHSSVDSLRLRSGRESECELKAGSPQRRGTSEV